MAITIDQASIGTPVSAAAGATTIAITTNVMIAAGARIVVSAACSGFAASSCSGGSLTWAVDKDGVNGTTGDHVSIITAFAPAGLASGTTITVTFGGSGTGRIIGGFSFLGGDTTASYLDGTPTTGTTTTSEAWTTGNYTTSGSSIMVAAVECDTTATHTATAPAIETIDKNEPSDGNSMAQEYRIEPTAGSRPLQGAFSFSTIQTVWVCCAYKEAAAVGGGPTPNLYVNRSNLNW